jgi:hypothetical protein
MHTELQSENLKRSDHLVHLGEDGGNIKMNTK